jgi:pimeloyl-ACP methyl ester carboxylesterase
MAWTTAVLLTAVCACQPSADSRATAGPRALDRLPADPDSSGRYVLYLHGRIVQEQGPRPTHPRFGTYEHHRILEALSVPGTTVLGPIRPPGTTVDEAAATARTSLDALLDAGVPASRITVVGFSMGGAAAIRIAARQPHDDLRFVLLAACGPWLDAWLADQPAVALHGTVLSIYEASDDIGGTCDSLRSHGLGGLTELELAIGGGHGAFYRPYPEWIDPTLAWISGGRLDSRPGPTASGPG